MLCPPLPRAKREQGMVCFEHRLKRVHCMYTAACDALARTLATCSRRGSSPQLDGRPVGCTDTRGSALSSPRAAARNGLGVRMRYRGARRTFETLAAGDCLQSPLPATPSTSGANPPPWVQRDRNAIPPAANSISRWRRLRPSSVRVFYDGSKGSGTRTPDQPGGCHGARPQVAAAPSFAAPELAQPFAPHQVRA